MFICIQKSTGKLVDSATTTTPGTMINNMVPYYDKDDLLEKEVTDEEFKVLLDQAQTQIPQVPTIDERLIAAESAINNLLGL